MALELGGIHHLTAITAQAAKNVDFYTRVLGMRLIKKTVNQDDVSAYHLFYGDGIASPGADLTFFDWPAAPNKRGNHEVGRTGLRVRSEADLVWWKQHLADARHRLGQHQGARRPPLPRFRGSRRPALPPRRRSERRRVASVGEKPDPRRAPDPRPRPHHPVGARPRPHRHRADQRDEHARSPHLPGARKERRNPRLRDGPRRRGGRTPRRGQPGPAAGPPGRRRRAPRRLPHPRSG